MNMPKYYTLSRDDVEVLDKKILYQGYFRIEKYRLKHRLFAGGWSESIERELFERGHGAAVLLYDPLLNQLVLIEQFRVGLFAAGANPWSLELVAGMMKLGEKPEEVVLRETVEEAGLAIQELMPICTYFASPGGSSEQLALFCARVDASSAGGIYGLKEEHEDIRVCVMSVSEVYAALDEGRIHNAAAIIAVQWFRLNQERIQQQWGNP